MTTSSEHDNKALETAAHNLNFSIGEMAKAASRLVQLNGGQLDVFGLAVSMNVMAVKIESLAEMLLQDRMAAYLELCTAKLDTIRAAMTKQAIAAPGIILKQ